MAKVNGVDVNDADVVNAIRNLTDRGWSTEQIMKHGYIGMPQEVIDMHRATRLHQIEGKKAARRRRLKKAVEEN